MELLNSFDEALQLEWEDGSAVLEPGDWVIMHNCGFHQARFVEPVLGGMLGKCGVGLIYQPPYSRDQHMWTVFPPNWGLFALTPTASWAWNENLMVQCILKITQEQSWSFFYHNGYVFLTSNLIAMLACNKQAVCYIWPPVSWDVITHLE